MAWNAYIAFKSNGKWSDTNIAEIKDWSEVNQVWSTMGYWDWRIKLNNNINNNAQLKDFIYKLRNYPWVAETKTAWWEEQ